MVINLLSNAAKFTSQGTVRITAVRDDDEIIVSVSDDGPGIAPVDQARVFEKFIQVGDTLTGKPQGTGLGLAISKEIIDRHGGRIWVESEPGRGSVFSFAIPVYDPVKIELDLCLKSAGVIGGISVKPEPNKKILIVDDEAHIRLLIQQTLEDLEDEGIEILSADNGTDAIQLAKQAAPQLIFLDVMMPNMDGLQVCQAIRQDLAMKEAYVDLTAKGQSYDRQRSLEAGANRYITKPFDPDELLELANSVLFPAKPMASNTLLNRSHPAASKP